MVAANTVLHKVVTDWEDFVRSASAFDIGSPLEITYLFRGQAREEWALVPSLIRITTAANLDSNQTLRIESKALREFQAQAALHLPGQMTPRSDDLIAWWALMQHHRAPTRLLDWTTSAFVAAYFAVESELDRPGAVWFVHGYTVEKYIADTHLGNELPRTIEETLRTFQNPSAPPVLYFGVPTPRTERMGAQQTAFTVSPQVLADHGQIITAAVAGRAGRALHGKLIIPATLKLDFLRRLRQFNITARALFPGIDGLGRSIAELIMQGAHYKGS